MFDFTRTHVMGIVNMTPDSFSDGGQFVDVDSVLRHIEHMILNGADMIDIGAESTRPDAPEVSEEEEIRRLEPILKVYKRFFSAPLSLDTMKSPVAEMGLGYGVDLINDVSGFMYDPKMPGIIGRSEAGVIIMHRQGDAKTMQHNPFYDNVISEVHCFLKEAIQKAQQAGIKFVCIDPGIGFGKTMMHNVTILNGLEQFKDLGCPILVGTSRKSFIGQITGDDVEHRLEGTLASVVAAIFRGANIVRVHDVKAVKKAVLVADTILRSSM